MADRNSLTNDAEEAMRIALDGRQSSLWTAMPGLIVSVDYAKMTCSVQPAIQGTISNPDGTTENVNLPVLVDVPIVYPGAKGYVLTFPLTAGDEVLVVFASRCIDSWWQSGGIQKAAEFRMHDLSDAFAIPGPRSVPNVVPSISSTGMVLRNEAGTVYVEIASDGKVKIVTTAGLTVAGDTTITGNLIVSGNISGTNIAASGVLSGASAAIVGSLTAGGVSIAGVPFGSHIHSGVTVGVGNTGGVV